MTFSRISIVTPTYNCAKTLQRTIESVIEQSYSNIEYLIIDGNSKDDTVEVIKLYAQKFSDRIKFISEKDKGIYDAMNKGTQMATGEWILYLGGDDYLHNRDVVSSIFSSNDFSSYNLIYGNILNQDGHIGIGEISRKQLLGVNIPHQAIFYRRSKVLELGGYNLKYRILADKVLNLQIFSEELERIKHLNITVSFYSNSGISATNYDKNFMEDVDQITLKLYQKHFSKAEIYDYIKPYSFINIRHLNLWKGVLCIYKAKKIKSDWRDILYCLMFRLGLKK